MPVKLTDDIKQNVVDTKNVAWAVAIEIRDTGIGIPKADLEQVLMGFETGNFVDSIKKGTGLGLTLVRALVELQGGTINIRSKPNQGTTVSLFLPDIALTN